eukprot:CAMPEP_0119126772 /NCGR_PEP_ID=MMETSP1310-20130426/5568_1 /TAXON_ID=464262 /ORGANISM="Genus nov. species nov., Strain RCC2339" /LENGTH=43 /DNA_ID= /DNA_START= /DNA_END= /DNA_ORIENTATION=
MWAREHGCEWDYNTVLTAAEDNGDGAMIEYVESTRGAKSVIRQ